MRDKFGVNTRQRRRDPFGTARKYGLHLCPRVRTGAMLRGDRIYYDGTASLASQREMITGCIAKHLLRKAKSGRNRIVAA